MAWLSRFLAGLIVGLLLLWGWRQMQGGGPSVVVDLVAMVDQATLRRPSADVFSVRESTVGGVTHRAIVVAQASRIAWDLDVPPQAWLDGAIALDESVWTEPGDGVLFRAGLSFDGRYEELVTQVVNPFEVPADRRWVPIAVDLSPYAGRKVSLILNTGAGATADNDVALWGNLRVATR